MTQPQQDLQPPFELHIMSLHEIVQPVLAVNWLASCSHQEWKIGLFIA